MVRCDVFQCCKQAHASVSSEHRVLPTRGFPLFLFTLAGRHPFPHLLRSDGCCGTSPTSGLPGSWTAYLIAQTTPSRCQLSRRMAKPSYRRTPHPATTAASHSFVEAVSK